MSADKATFRRAVDDVYRRRETNLVIARCGVLVRGKPCGKVMGRAVTVGSLRLLLVSRPTKSLDSAGVDRFTRWPADLVGGPLKGPTQSERDQFLDIYDITEGLESRPFAGVTSPRDDFVVWCQRHGESLLGGQRLLDAVARARRTRQLQNLPVEMVPAEHPHSPGRSGNFRIVSTVDWNDPLNWKAHGM